MSKHLTLNNETINQEFFKDHLNYFTEVSFGENKLNLKKRIENSKISKDDWQIEKTVSWNEDLLVCIGDTKLFVGTKDSGETNVPESIQEIVVVACGAIERNKNNEHGILFMPVWVSHAGVFLSPKEFVENSQKNLVGGLHSWYTKFYAKYDRLIPAVTYSFVLQKENDNQEFHKMMFEKWQQEIAGHIEKVMKNISEEFSL